MSKKQPAARPPRRIEVISAPLLLRIHSLPRVVFPLFITLLLLGGLFAPASFAWLGGVLLLIVGAVLLWLVALSWPLLTGTSRVTRSVLLMLVFGYAIGRLLGRV